MVKATLITDKGPIALVGINDENVRRLRAGLPIDINLKELTPPGTRLNRLVLHLAHTYAEVVEDMEKVGMPVEEALRKAAKDMDAQIKRERR